MTIQEIYNSIMPEHREPVKYNGWYGYFTDVKVNYDKDTNTPTIKCIWKSWPTEGENPSYIEAEGHCFKRLTNIERLLYF